MLKIKKLLIKKIRDFKRKRCIPNVWYDDLGFTERCSHLIIELEFNDRYGEIYIDNGCKLVDYY